MNKAVKAKKRPKTSEVIKILGPAIQFARLQRHFSMKDLSRLTQGKLDASYIGRIERMEQDPSLRMIDTLLKAFDISLYKLLEPITLSKSPAQKRKATSKSESLLKKLPLMKSKDIEILDNFAKLLIFWKKDSDVKKIISRYDQSLGF